MRNEEYICSECGKQIEEHYEECPYCGSPFNEPTSFEKVDFSDFTSFVNQAFVKIIRKHPELREYSLIENYYCKDCGKKYNGYYRECSYCGDDINKHINFSILSPVSGIFPLEIIAIEGEESEITIYFGPAQIRLHIYKTPNDQIEAMEEIIQKVLDEKLISVIYRSRFLFFTIENHGLISSEKYKQLIDKRCLISAVSWKGSFNYNSEKTP